jgi:hypothetical protein
MDKPDDKKIIRFTSKGKNKPFPPGMRIQSMHFYAPAINVIDGPLTTPCVSHVFEKPATLEEAVEVIKNVSNNLGIEGKVGKNYVFIPWPCAAIYFDLMKN